jgi:hypothetical protein
VTSGQFELLVDGKKMTARPQSRAVLHLNRRINQKLKRAR